VDGKRGTVRSMASNGGQRSLELVDATEGPDDGNSSNPGRGGGWGFGNAIWGVPGLVWKEKS
jgi:hypothetical protein